MGDMHSFKEEAVGAGAGAGDDGKAIRIDGLEKGGCECGG